MEQFSTDISNSDENYSKGDETRVLALILLVSFLKFKAIPSFAVAGFVEEGLLALYRAEDPPEIKRFTFVKLTYRGRKMAEKCAKILRTTLDEEKPWAPSDPYDKYGNEDDTEEDVFYLMHHKRFTKEFKEGDTERLISIYETRIVAPLE